MAAKKVQIGHSRGVAPPPDNWVKQKPAIADEPMKRLTVDIPESLHTRMKIACATKKQNISDLVRSLLERELAA